VGMIDLLLGFPIGDSGCQRNSPGTYGAAAFLTAVVSDSGVLIRRMAGKLVIRSVISVSALLQQVYNKFPDKDWKTCRARHALRAPLMSFKSSVLLIIMRPRTFFAIGWSRYRFRIVDSEHFANFAASTTVINSSGEYGL